MKIKTEYRKAAIVSVAYALAAGLVLIGYQAISAYIQDKRIIDDTLDEIPARLEQEKVFRLKEIMAQDKSFQSTLLSAEYMLETVGEDDFFRRIAESGDISDVFFLTDKKGKVRKTVPEKSDAVGSSVSELYGVSEEDIRELLGNNDGGATKVYHTEDGLFKLFATPIAGHPRGYCLVMPVQYSGEGANLYSLEGSSGLFGLINERCAISSIDNVTLRLGIFNTEDQNFTGKHISRIGLDRDVTLSPSEGHSNASGKPFHYRTVQHNSDIFGDITILTVRFDKNAISVAYTLISMLAILIISLLLQIYALMVDEDPSKIQTRLKGMQPLKRTGYYMDTEKARILMPFSLLSIIIITVVGFYLYTISLTANQGRFSVWNINNLSSSITGINEKFYDEISTSGSEMKAFQEIMASVIENKSSKILNCDDAMRLKAIFRTGDDDEQIPVTNANGEQLTVEVCNPWLKKLADVQNADDVTIYDSGGNMIATSGSDRNRRLSRNDESSSAIIKVIDGASKSDISVSDGHMNLAAQMTLFETKSKDFHSFVSLGELPGDRFDVREAVLVSTFSFGSDNAEHSILSNLNNILDDSSKSDYFHYLLYSGEEDHKIIYKPSSPYLADISGITLPDEAFHDGYLGFLKFNGKKYFHNTRLISGSKGSFYLMSLVSNETAYSRRLGNTAITFLITLIVILGLLSSLLVYDTHKFEAVKKEASDDIESRNAMSTIQREKLDTEIRKRPTASQRILSVMGRIWKVILFIAAVFLIYGLLSGPKESLSGYLLSFTWQRGINIFSLTTMIIITLSMGFGLNVLNSLMSVLGNALNASAETVCQLLVSILKYGCYITIAFVTLYMIGVDTTGVLASLGALSVMIGLGAKNLITDVLAGISIIMEGDYKVGDIVKIGDFCGKVSEIGIRTTKIEDIEGNIKIFYNSTINGVINMTNKLSALRISIKISSRHGFTEMENALEELFARLECRYPQIKEPIKYLGVQESTPAYNVYLISITCEQEDSAALQRAMTKEISEFCNEKGIEKL